MGGSLFLTQFALICSIFIYESSASAKEFPKRMAALGDSISEALLADYSVESGVGTGELLSMLELARIEDKEERALAFRQIYASYGKSWSTGSDDSNIVYSHFERLLEGQPNLEAYNFAISGARSSALKFQVDALLEMQEREGELFDYVTIMMGANDLISPSLEKMTPALEYVANLEDALRRILQKNPKAWILLVGLPDIFSVFESTKDIVVEKIWKREFTCDEVRKNIYGNYPIFHPEDKKTYRAVKALMQSYREGMLSLADRIQKEFPESRVKAIRELYPQQNPKKAMSIDCFHPSEWGQAELAELSWGESFWSDSKGPIH